MNSADIFLEFSSLSEWSAWAKKNPAVFSAEHAKALRDAIERDGLIEPISGERFSATQVTIAGENYRETIRAGKLISRHRALLLVLEKLIGRKNGLTLGRHTRIYAPEALTDFALYLRSFYPRFLGSEYAETEREKQDLFPIQCQDLLALSLPSGAFDIVFSNDVFEHVPDLDKALKETARILRESGVLISTFPFAFQRQTGVVKTRLQDGAVIHVTEPEYHGNPMRPEQGSLVFEIPGWDVLERAKSAGFESASMTLVCSAKHGVLGKDINGVFVFVATRPKNARAE